MSRFTLASDGIDLPKGAWADTHRRRLRIDGRSVLALTQGRRRNYAFPLYTPAGYCVTAEAPADHPHHCSLWVASDHVYGLMPAVGGTFEEYTYNFYVDDTFQGRAPGRIVEVDCAGTQQGDDRFEIVQQLEWRGPAEWAAPQGRCVALETRSLTVTAGQTCHRIDLSSRLSARDWGLRLGPTRHAYFNVRVADSMIVANGGIVRDDRGRRGGAAISGEGARWVDFSGPVGGGATAGVTLISHREDGREPFWFVADWGVVSVGPFRARPLDLAQGESFETSCTILAHDGGPDEDEIGRIGSAGIRGGHHADRPLRA